MAELEAMPGFRLNGDLAALGRAGHVMYKNAEELSHHADQFLRSRRHFSRDVDDEFEKELVSPSSTYRSRFAATGGSRSKARTCR